LLPGGSKAVPRQEFSFQIPPLGYLINRKTATKWRAIKFFTVHRRVGARNGARSFTGARKLAAGKERKKERKGDTTTRRQSLITRETNPARQSRRMKKREGRDKSRATARRASDSSSLSRGCSPLLLLSLSLSLSLRSSILRDVAAASAVADLSLPATRRSTALAMHETNDPRFSLPPPPFFPVAVSFFRAKSFPRRRATN